MATPAFGAAFEASLKQPIQGGRLTMNSGLIDNPLFFCCISGNTVGVDKAPVPSLIVSPQDACEGDLVDADFSHSWSPTSTLDLWEVDWGDGGAPDAGNWPALGHVTHAYTLPAGETCHTYDITLTVTDLLTATGVDMKQVVVCECPVAPFFRLMNNEVFGCDGGEGVFYTTDFGDANPNYFPNNDGLVVAGSRQVYDLKSYVWPNPGSESLFMCCYCGIYECTLPLPSAWTARITTGDIATLAGIAAYDDLWIDEMAISIEKSGWMWAFWRTNRVVGGDRQAYCGIAHTRDGWQTLHSATVLEGGWIGLGYTINRGSVAIGQHSNGQLVYGAYHTSNFGGGAGRVYQSENGGGTFALVDEIFTGSYTIYNTSIHVPYHSAGWWDGDVYWGFHGGNVRRSEDRAAAFANVFAAGNLDHIVGPVLDKDTSGVIADCDLYEWQTGGARAGYGVWGCTNGGQGRDGRVRVRLANFLAQEWLWVGVVDGAGRRIKLYTDAPAIVDKTGNWDAVTGNAPVYCAVTPPLMEY